MKVLGVVATAVLALSLAGPSFANDKDCPLDSNGNVAASGHGGYYRDSNGNLHKCEGAAVEAAGATAGVAAPAVASGAAVGGLSGGVIAGIAAVAVVAVAVGASGGGSNTNHGTTGTTATH